MFELVKRKPIVGMSWAMRQNKNAEALEFSTHLVDLLQEKETVEQFIFPSMGTLAAVAPVLKDSVVGLGAQNIAPFSSGEYSGEYSIDSLIDIGGQYVELGHWERRKLFGDTDEWINKKLLLTLEKGLTPVLCVGEENRLDASELRLVLKRQLFNDLLGIAESDISRIIIAYTPAWAVGKSRASNAPHIHQAGQMIRDILKEFYSVQEVEKIRIIYGGSVSPENTALIVQNEAIDGVFLGRFGSIPERYAEVVQVVADQV